MRKRYWNRKVSALLMAGLVLSALPVHAFAEEEQGSVDVAAQANLKDEEPKDVQTEGEDNAFGTQDGLVSGKGTSELKGTEVDTENQGDAGKDADTDMNTDKDAGTDAEVGDEKETETEASSAEKSEAENLTEKSSASGTETSEEKAEATSEVKPATEEELAEETLQPEELTLASASDIPMTDTAAETEASLLGTWTVDGYTSLAFYGDGKGAMLLPTESYDFHYSLNDDQLDLDFVSSRARDLSYTISLDTDTLQLISGTGTNTVAITLQRVE